ncbi:MAG: tRNA threonylcarbamoyladenosine dehydratase [Pseudomonadota bacterium]
MSRFERVELLLGAPAVARLAAARVTVVGLGAVGSYATEALARAGVGHLRLADFDTIQPSNLNRQLYALESTLGRPKVEVARARVLDIHPACEVEALDLFVHEDTVGRVLEGPPDVLVDAIDSLNPKLALLEAAVRAGVPVVSCMGAALKVDPAAVRVAPLEQTRICTLARQVRKRLGRRGIHGGIRCVFSIEPPAPAIGARRPEEHDDGRGRVRTTLGSLPTLPGIFGLVAANEALVQILGGWGGVEG